MADDEARDIMSSGGVCGVGFAGRTPPAYFSRAAFAAASAVLRSSIVVRIRPSGG